jgi:hypothetical protein
MKTRKNMLTSALLCLAFVAASHHGYAATIGFQPPVTYPVGTNPRAVSVADFNGDEILDLAVVNFGFSDTGDNGGVSILLGNGDGTFQPARNFGAGKMPESIAIADFNGDNKPDIVAVSELANVLNVLFGNGDGTFQAPVTVALDVDPYYVVAGDFNNDHKSDLALFGLGRDLDGDGIRDSAGGIAVLLGNADGTFQAGALFGAPGISLVVADFNRDGSLDLAAGQDIFLGNGDGSFQAPKSNAVPGGAVDAGDFNGDGKPDIVAMLRVHVCGWPPTQCDGRIDVLLGNGDGSFSSTFSKTGGYWTLAVGDFDGDGNLDLAVRDVDAPDNANPVFRGDGKGKFTATGKFIINNHARGFILARDLNGDKLPDLVSTRDDNTIAVQLNATVPEPSFSISASTPSPAIVSRGQSSTSTVTLSSLNAFDNPVALACSVQPTQSAPMCSLDPNSVTFDANGNATAILTINTGTATASLVAPSPVRDSRPLQFLWLPVAGFALMGAGFGSSCSTRRRLTVCLLGGMLSAAVIFQAACGGGSSGGRSTTGPLSTTYTITVTGTSGSTQHSTTTMLTVQ